LHEYPGWMTSLETKTAELIVSEQRKLLDAKRGIGRRRGYVSPRDSELADVAYRSWCNGGKLIEAVAEACAIAREEGRAETCMLDTGWRLGTVCPLPD
jgi:hypothetical protein